LELANVPSPFAFAFLLADHLVTPLLKRIEKVERGAIVSCIGPRRGLRGSRQRDERKHQHDRPRWFTSIMASGSVALRLWQRNLTIWNAAIHCTLVVRDILIVSLR
jgi:hypothetical protein